MFSAGMGTDIKELKNSGKAGFMVAVLGVVVPFLMGTALAWGADELGLIETTGFLESVFTGTILTATSVSITVETLKEMKKLETKVGNTILAAALIDDVLGLVALTLVCSLAGGDESIGMVLLKIAGFFVFAFVVGFAANRVFCWMLKRQHGWASHRNSVFAFVLCLVMAYCAVCLCPMRQNSFLALPILQALTPRVLPWPARPREPIFRRSTIPWGICCSRRSFLRASASTCRSRGSQAACLPFLSCCC